VAERDPPGLAILRICSAEALESVPPKKPEEAEEEEEEEELEAPAAAVLIRDISETFTGAAAAEAAARAKNAEEEKEDEDEGAAGSCCTLASLAGAREDEGKYWREDRPPPSTSEASREGCWWEAFCSPLPAPPLAPLPPQLLATMSRGVKP
jgi:hypothetical protein